MRNLLATASILFTLVGAACATVDGQHAGHGSDPSGVPTYAGKVNWHTLAEGREMARSAKKPMIVDFAVPEGCDRCDFLQDNVYNRDEIVDKINADFVPIWVNLDGATHTLTEDEQNLGRKFDYRKDCLLLFLDHQEKVIEDPEGKQFCFVEEVEPGEFMKYLDYVRTEYVPAR